MKTLSVAEAIEAAPAWLLKAADHGQNCPRCQSALIKCVGANPDGINMNAAYDCQVCGAQWEGL